MKLVPALSISLVALATATPTPSISCPSTPSHSNNAFGIPGSGKTIFTSPGPFSATTTTSSSSSSNIATSSLHDLASNPLHVRGGALHEPETVQDVDALLLNAASNDQLVVIDFTASWCGPCKMIAPLFKELSEQRTDVVFLKVDVDENPETAAKFSVSAMPTFLFIKKGEVVDRLMGANAQRLQELIEEHV